MPIDLVVPRHLLRCGRDCRAFRENIRVTQHRRSLPGAQPHYVFGDDDEAKVYLSSADWMPRNFHRRVEVMFPVEAEDLRRRIVEEILPAYLMDNNRARILNSDGTYSRATAEDGIPTFRSQTDLLTISYTRAPPRHLLHPPCLSPCNSLLSKQTAQPN